MVGAYDTNDVINKMGKDVIRFIKKELNLNVESNPLIELKDSLIQNSKIDYVNELIGSSFKITNPQASSSCGCGTSFSI